MPQTQIVTCHKFVSAIKKTCLSFIAAIPLAVAGVGYAASCTVLTPASQCQLGTLMEEFQETRANGRYFITACTNEIATVSQALNTANPPASAFRKTGESIPVFPASAAGATPLSRYQVYLPDAANVSHFYTALEADREIVKSTLVNTSPARGCEDGFNTANWILPAPLSATNAIQRGASKCPVSTAPIWRLLRQSASNINLANHRFLTNYDLAVSETQKDATWSLDGLAGCADDRYAIYTFNTEWQQTATTGNGQTLAVGNTVTLRVIYESLNRSVGGAQANLRLLLPAGVEYVDPVAGVGTNQPICVADIANARGLICTLPGLSAASASDAIITFRATSAYAAQDAATRTVKASIGLTNGASAQAISQSPASCESRGVPHIGCSIIVLPAAAVVATQAALIIEVPNSNVAAVMGQPLPSATFKCTNSGSISAKNVTCAATPSVTSPLSLTCLPSATVTDLVAGQSISCAVNGAPTASGVTIYELAATASNAAAPAKRNLTLTVTSVPPPATTTVLTTSAPARQTVKLGVAVTGLTFTCTNTGTNVAEGATCVVTGVTEIGLNPPLCSPTSPAALAINATVTCTVSGTPSKTGVITVTASATNTAAKTSTTQITVETVDTGTNNGIDLTFGAVSVGAASTDASGNVNIPISSLATVVATSPIVSVYVYPQYLLSGVWTTSQQTNLPTLVQASNGNTLAATIALPAGTASPASVRLCASRQGSSSQFELANVGCRTPNSVSASASATFTSASTLATLSLSSSFLPAATRGRAYPLSSVSFGIANSGGTVNGLACSAQGFPTGIVVGSCTAAPNNLVGAQSSSCSCNLSGIVGSLATSSTVTFSASASSGASPSSINTTVIVDIPPVVIPVGIDLTRVSVSQPAVTASGSTSNTATVTANLTGSGTGGSAYVHFEWADATAATPTWTGVAFDQGVVNVIGTPTSIAQTFAVPTTLTSAKYRICIVPATSGLLNYGFTSCGTATSTTTSSAISPITVLSFGPPPAVVAVTWKTGASEAPSALQVGRTGTWTVAVAPKVTTPASTFVGPLYLSVAIPANAELVSTTMSDGSPAPTCVGAADNTVLQCAVQTGASAALAGEVAYKLTVRAKPGSGGLAFAMTALASATASTSVTCAQVGTTGDGCAKSASITPTYYDLRVQSADITTLQLPITATPLSVQCEADAGTYATAALPDPLTATCSGSVTYDDDTRDVIAAQSFTNRAAVATLCTSDSAAGNCLLNLKPAPRTVKTISLTVNSPPVDDNLASNNSRVLYNATSNVACTDQNVNYSRTFNGASMIQSPNIDQRMRANEILAIEVIDGAAISKSPSWPYPGISIFWGGRDGGAARDFSISQCRGDFSASSQTIVSANNDFSSTGAAYFYITSPTELAAPPNLGFPYFAIRQNPRGRWFINVRLRNCLPISADNTSCTMFYSVGSS